MQHDFLANDANLVDISQNDKKPYYHGKGRYIISLYVIWQKMLNFKFI